jgi:ferredoxin
VGQDKRQMHYDLGRNILAINEVIAPDLVLVDGLVGMEGNGPGDGDPFRFGYLLCSDNAFLNDRVVCRLVGLPVEEVPYLLHAREAGRLEPAVEAEIDATLPILRPIRPAPPRSRLAELSEARSLLWLKKAVRPIVSRPKVSELAYKLKIIQDVYSLQDDTLRLVGRSEGACGDCGRCADFCPTGLTREQIGRELSPSSCVQCLYCWWVCPKDALKLEGEPLAMERQIGRYKKAVEGLTP